MIDRKMVKVPTPDGMVETQDGTIVLDTADSELWFARDGGVSQSPDGYIYPHTEHTKYIIVGHPDDNARFNGDSTSDEWVELTTDQVLLLPDRTPVLVMDNEVKIEGLLDRERTTAKSLSLHNADDVYWVNSTALLTVYVRPDDDPMAERIEKVAQVLYESAPGLGRRYWDILTPQSVKDEYRQIARTAILTVLDDE